MKMTSRWKTGLAALVAAGTVFGAAAVSDVANALPAGTPPAQPDGGLQLSPSSGTFATPMAIQFSPGNQTCPGDNGTGWAYSPYITAEPASEIPRIAFSGVGQVQTLNAGVRTSAWRDGGGTLSRGIFPSLQSPPGSDTAFVNNIGNLSWNSSFSANPLTPGVYTIGVACYSGNASTVGGVAVPALETGRYWTTEVTVTATGWVEGVAPDAPQLSLGAGSPTGTERTIIIDNPDATLDAYILDVSLPLGDPLPTVTPGDTSFVLTGLTPGESYDVELDAVKAGFAGATSNTLSFTAEATGPAPVVDAPDVFEANDATVSWTVPTVVGIPAPASFDVTVAGGTAVTPFVGVAGPSVTIPAAELGLGSYTVTVTPNYAPGSGVTGTPGSDTFNVNPNALLFQEISVTRPPGVLILTQRCGVFGPLDGFVAVDGFPGFPRTLGARTASADQVGSAPTIIGGPLDGQPDPEFGNYPLPIPATYPTECGLDMGTARFVTSGNLAGQFYTADGRMNQVTVLDTRDTDTGWIARGFVEDFSSGGDTFAGSYLGWTPQVTDDSDPVGGSTYDQVVTEGPQVLPGTAPGLTVNSILGESQANEGLGIATMDARMKLLIPASADAGDYAATLSLSVIPRPIP